MNEMDMYRMQNEMNTDSQSRLQSEQGEVQGRLVAPQLREQIAEAQAAVIAQTNPARALRIILEGFRGYMEDENGEYQKIGFPLMNDKGIARLASMLIPFVNDPVRFGHLREEEVRSFALQIADDLTEEIGLNWRDYGIMEPSMKDIILDSLVTLIFITITRSEDGGEKNFLSRVILESIGSSQKKKKEESFWGKHFKL